MAWQGKPDPMEEATEKWLLTNGIRYERMDAGIGLDFFLPDFDLYIEVKRFHSPRIGEQMSRAENVIAIQGIKSFNFLTDMIYWKRARDLEELLRINHPDYRRTIVASVDGL